MALAAIGNADAQALYRLTEHPLAAVRMAVLLALRRMKDPHVATFLSDPQSELGTEAARAIYDTPIREAWPILAQEVNNVSRSELILRRALVANYRLGTPEHADAVARFAANPSASEALRLEAIGLLSTWSNPEQRDPLLGYWWPLEPRKEEIAAGAVRKNLPGLLAAPPAVRTAALDLAAELGIAEAAEGLLATFRDREADSTQRGQALRALAALETGELESLIEAGLADRQAAVRITARALLAARDPQAALVAAREALHGSEIPEQQAAFDLLASLPESPQRTALLRDGLERLGAGSLPAELELELLAAAGKCTDPELDEQLAGYRAAQTAQGTVDTYRDTLAGGDPARGRALFFYQTELACLRCHKVEGQGGTVGPDLSKIDSKKTREYLLESILFPSAQIDERYASYEIETSDGKLVTGLKVSDGPRGVELLQADGRRILVPQQDIESIRVIRQSAMPEGVAEKLSRRQLRDLVAFLASLRAGAPEQSSVQP